ncbi:CaiB/BaiF CoA transferase family protein [Nocardioides terrisoli]|uniref:CaiB/BaiF CoA transferase family protein n=1 Tax=Nocardioides terrisoli TaxID=3388267 RepID=UPI00287BC1ED|nr:CoA transferase [Nocardioides marmorisolisilvae]
MSALDGVRVLCVGQFYFAPYCTMLLGRLGADVIKVESPAGDPYRHVPTGVDADFAVQYGLVNSGKRNISINLRTEQGATIFKRLVETADVVVQNLAPGAFDRFGLGYEELSRVNPRVILASGTGFGSFGPRAGQPAMDLTVQALTAVMSTTGFPDGAPVRTGPSVVDFIAGSHLAAAVLAALFERTITGRGQHVEVALQDAIIPSLSSNIAGYVSSGGSIPERTGNRNGGLAVSPYNAYEASDGWLALICPTDAHWRRMRDLIDDPRAHDARLDTNKARCAAMDKVDDIVAHWVRGHTRAEIVDRLADVNVLCEPVVTLPELLADEHVKARGVVREVVDQSGRWWAFGSPIFMSASPQREPLRPEAKGQSTDSILAGDLGLTEAEIAALRASNSIA